jgi:hypothetical protein
MRSRRVQPRLRGRRRLPARPALRRPRWPAVVHTHVRRGLALRDGAAVRRRRPRTRPLRRSRTRRPRRALRCGRRLRIVVLRPGGVPGRLHRGRRLWPERALSAPARGRRVHGGRCRRARGPVPAGRRLRLGGLSRGRLRRRLRRDGRNRPLRRRPTLHALRGARTLRTRVCRAGVLRRAGPVSARRRGTPLSNAGERRGGRGLRRGGRLPGGSLHRGCLCGRLRRRLSGGHGLCARRHRGDLSARRRPGREHALCPRRGVPQRVLCRGPVRARLRRGRGVPRGHGLCRVHGGSLLLSGLWPRRGLRVGRLLRARSGRAVRVFLARRGHRGRALSAGLRVCVRSVPRGPLPGCLPGWHLRRGARLPGLPARGVLHGAARPDRGRVLRRCRVHRRGPVQRRPLHAKLRGRLPRAEHLPAGRGAVRPDLRPRRRLQPRVRVSAPRWRRAVLRAPRDRALARGLYARGRVRDRPVSRGSMRERLSGVQQRPRGRRRGQPVSPRRRLRLGALRRRRLRADLPGGRLRRRARVCLRRGRPHLCDAVQRRRAPVSRGAFLCRRARGGAAVPWAPRRGAGVRRLCRRHRLRRRGPGVS